MHSGRPVDEADGTLSTPVHGVTTKTLKARLDELGSFAATFAAACGFKGDSGQTLLIPNADGALSAVLFGLDASDSRRRDPFLAGKLASALPEGRFRLADGFDDPFLAALGFELASYKFTRFKASKDKQPVLDVPPEIDASTLERVRHAVYLGRDLINRPANDLGPAALEAAIRDVADAHGANVTTTEGDALEHNFPMIHAVGRAASEAPRLVDVTWGAAAAPKVTLVGKGVCFDTGGLNIKPDASMLLMKKDMGGAAAALALAEMVMDAKLPVRLRLLVPIVENSIAGNAFRPGDVLKSRKGLTVEVGNTDAEGRLILADALSLADEEEPDLLFDFATLTGAARVALGPDLPPYYTMSDALAADIARFAEAANDPGWRMPLWEPYDQNLKSKVADMNNISGGGFAGSITAALFLRRFVTKSKNWAHFDIFGWTPSAKPGRPEGGEVQMARGLYDLLTARYGKGTL